MKWLKPVPPWKAFEVYGRRPVLIMVALFVVVWVVGFTWTMRTAVRPPTGAYLAGVEGIGGLEQFRETLCDDAAARFDELGSGFRDSVGAEALAKGIDLSEPARVLRGSKKFMVVKWDGPDGWRSFSVPTLDLEDSAVFCPTVDTGWLGSPR